MSQFYPHSSAGFTLLVCFSLLENGLIIPLIHETDLISSPRMSLQKQQVLSSCRDQTPGAFSGRLWSGAAQLSPLLLCSWALTLFWTVAVPVLSHFCVREVFGGTCVNWFPGSFYSRKHHWERGKWKIVRVKAVPKVVWRICELHKCTDLIIWHLDSCGLQLLWKPVIAAVRFYKNLEITA